MAIGKDQEAAERLYRQMARLSAGISFSGDVLPQECVPGLRAAFLSVAGYEIAAHQSGDDEVALDTILRIRVMLEEQLAYAKAHQ